MTTIEPFLPDPPERAEIPAADPGAGGPEPSPGLGVAGEEPDSPAAPASPQEPGGAGREPDLEDNPFRTPEVPER